MQRCLEFGRKAMQSGDAPVGSLISLEDKIIAEGIEAVKTKSDPTAHSEIMAIRIACEKLQTLDLSGATLYTNVEPCVMCAFAIRQTGIRSVIFGLSNKQVGGVNSKFPILIDTSFPAKYTPPEIRAGVLLEECENLWREFGEFQKIKR